MREKLKIVNYGPEVTRIGVIADTHLPTRARYIPGRVFELFSEVQLILHAGDLVSETVIAELETIAPVEAVAGNMDPLHLDTKLGRLKLIKIGSLSIGLLHGDISGHNIQFNRISELFLPDRPEVVVFGHLHEPIMKRVDGILYFNPGSAVEPRRVKKASCGLLTRAGEKVSGKIIYL